MDTLLCEYVAKGPPFLGDCAFRDKLRVKAVGARWNATHKKWSAPTEDALIALIETGLWLPMGHDRSFASAILNHVKVVAPRRTQAAVAAAPAAPAAPARANAAPESGQMRRELQVPPDEPELVAEARAHGVSQLTITKSADYPQFGPRSGISDVARLRRAVHLEVCTWSDVATGRAAVVAKRARTGSGKGKGVKRGAVQGGRRRAC